MTEAVTTTNKFLVSPVRVGLVGTGYAAKLRAEAIAAESRAQLVAVAGHTPEKTEVFSRTYGAVAEVSWRRLVEREDLDLVMISTISRDHDLIARAALLAGKHVVVEYPLSFSVAEAESLIALSESLGLLLHVEHIELIGGVHQALRKEIPLVGEVFYSRYITVSPKKQAPYSWSYQADLFGFPLTGALSRLHRLTDLFGKVATVSSEIRYWNASQPGFFRACLCTAQLRFLSGVVAEVVYGKGETFCSAERKLEVYGNDGVLIFEGDEGRLVRAEVVEPVDVGPRRGSFAKDTQMVIDFLLEGTPLYVTPQASLYTLKVADAASQSAQTGLTVAVDG
ncbi:MAG TPA: Gfo/Idh/MocA family oxidoreductase [Halomicronema sp.]